MAGDKPFGFCSPPAGCCRTRTPTRAITKQPCSDSISMLFCESSPDGRQARSALVILAALLTLSLTCIRSIPAARKGSCFVMRTTASHQP